MIKILRKSFSQQLKSELLNIDYLESDEEKELFLAACLAASGIFRQDQISIKSQNKEFVYFFKNISDSLDLFDSEVEEKKASAIWSSQDNDFVIYLRDLLLERLGFSTARGSISKTASDFRMKEQQILLRSFFLTSGSIANPEKSYQVEFSLRRQQVLQFIKQILDAFEIESFIQKNQHYQMLYIKNGDDISTFLGAIVANQAFLVFENERVKKNMNEIVNRAVNCDQANMQRVANTAARQIALIRSLEERGLYQKLPDELREIAHLRVQYPGYSLRELGEYMDPPLGKSGVNHRLGKLERLANDLLELE